MSLRSSAPAQESHRGRVRMSASSRTDGGAIRQAQWTCRRRTVGALLLVDRAASTLRTAPRPRRTVPQCRCRRRGTAGRARSTAGAPESTCRPGRRPIAEHEDAMKRAIPWRKWSQWQCAFPQAAAAAATLRAVALAAPAAAAATTNGCTRVDRRSIRIDSVHAACWQCIVAVPASRPLEQVSTASRFLPRARESVGPIPRRRPGAHGGGGGGA